MQVKVISGDSELVTRHVCAQLHLPVEGVLTGAELASMDTAALRGLVEKTTLFCRMTPAQKERVVLACKHLGHTVGYMGDGINDAPALHAADVGISVESATDVAGKPQASFCSDAAWAWCMTASWRAGAPI